MTAQQLKNSILQMAIQGKLVPQDPSDEPANILIERIRKEKDRLVKEKKIKREKYPSLIYRGKNGVFYEKMGNEVKDISDDIPFEIPNSWEWVRLSSLGEIVGGGTPKTSDSACWDNGIIPWITPADMKFVTTKYVTSGKRNISEYGLKTSSARMMPAGTLIYSSRAPIGYIAIAANELCTNQGFKSLVPAINDINYFMYYCLIAFTPAIQARASGTTFKEISGTEFAKTLVPIPPLAEQQRIVQKIENVLPHLDEYSEKESSLRQLNKKFSDSLKKSILQWAVQGKLTEQDPSDEPSIELLKRIKAEKAKLIKDGKIKKTKQEALIYRKNDSYYEKVENTVRCIDDELPFDIPNSWEWVRLGNIIKLTSGQDLSPDKYNAIGRGIPYITGASNIDDGDIIINRWTENARAVAHKGNLLLTCKGTVGTMAFLQEPQAHIARQIMSIESPYKINLLYLHVFLDSYVATLKASAKSMIPGISREDVLNIYFPIPPAEEQHRIFQLIKRLAPMIKSMKGSVPPHTLKTSLPHS